MGTEAATETMAAKPPSATEQAKAGAEVVAAALDARRLRWEAELADFEASLEEAFSEQGANPVSAVAGERTTAESSDAALLAAARRTLFEELDPRAIGAALQSIADEEAEAERVRRLYEAMRARAERRAERVRRVLWPVVVAWLEANPPPATKAGKPGATWKFPNTILKIVKKAHDGKVEVESTTLAVKALEKALGMDAYACFAVTTTIKVGEAKDALVARKIDPATIAGLAWTKPGFRYETHGGGA